jgi:hypothetical protein
MSTAGTPQDTYSEGLFIDYGHFDQADIEPRFAFGFGLSYTTSCRCSFGVSRGPNVCTSAHHARYISKPARPWDGLRRAETG